MFLAQAGSEVTIVVRRDLSATMSNYLIDRIEAHPRVEVHVGIDGHRAGRRASRSSA